MGKKTKKPGKGKEKTERKTAKADEKKARREGKKLSPEDDIDAILVITLSLRFCIGLSLGISVLGSALFIVLWSIVIKRNFF